MAHVYVGTCSSVRISLVVPLEYSLYDCSVGSREYACERRPGEAQQACVCPRFGLRLEFLTLEYLSVGPIETMFSGFVTPGLQVYACAPFCCGTDIAVPFG